MQGATFIIVIVCLGTSREHPIFRCLSRTTGTTAPPRHALHPFLEGLVLYPRFFLLGVVLFDQLQARFQVLFQLEGPFFSVAFPRGLLGRPHSAEPRDLVAVLLEDQVPPRIPSGAGLAAEVSVGPVLEGGFPQVVGDPLANPRSAPDFPRRLDDVVVEGRYCFRSDLLWLQSVFAVLAQVAEGGSHCCFCVCKNSSSVLIQDRILLLRILNCAWRRNLNDRHELEWIGGVSRRCRSSYTVLVVVPRCSTVMMVTAIVMA
mmetsp:Transcript_18911/g.38843  ORF Transcript_18911/g.38843 Transcript_18911/m.38843 type:complete len:260 (-) Transcript_18911:33-812(-)